MTGQVRIHRHAAADRFTTLPNSLLQDRTLSWGARGLLAYLLSLPQDWNIRITEVMERGLEGKARFYRIKDELEVAGYLRGEVVQDYKGVIRGNVWEVTDTPGVFGDEPDSGNPESGKPGKRETRIPENPPSGNPPTTKDTFNKEQIDKRHTHKGACAESPSAEPEPNPEPPSRPVDGPAMRHQHHPWLNSRNRPVDEFVEFVIRSLPKKDDRAEALNNARAYIRKVDRLEGRLDAVLQLWEDFQQHQAEQAEAERRAKEDAEIEAHLARRW